jgi:hypothetical protein
MSRCRWNNPIDPRGRSARATSGRWSSSAGCPTSDRPSRVGPAS